MLPGDQGALWKVIYRRDVDWETSFILQHETLQPWLVSARNALCISQGPQTMSLEDVELQVRYILFLLGQHAAPGSSFPAECVGSHRPPYRPFGVRASIALICHVFEGIQARELEGYESKDLWPCDETILSTTLGHLRLSPLFNSEISMHQLRSMLLNLQEVFQQEEIRVASVRPQTVNIGSPAEVLKYYRRAFLALNPMLLPDILNSIQRGYNTRQLLEQYHLGNINQNLDRGWYLNLKIDPLTD